MTREEAFNESIRRRREAGGEEQRAAIPMMGSESEEEGSVGFDNEDRDQASEADVNEIVEETPTTSQGDDSSLLPLDTFNVEKIISSSTLEELLKGILHSDYLIRIPLSKVTSEKKASLIQNYLNIVGVYQLSIDEFGAILDHLQKL